MDCEKAREEYLFIFNGGWVGKEEEGMRVAKMIDDHMTSCAQCHYWYVESGLAEAIEEQALALLEKAVRNEPITASEKELM